MATKPIEGVVTPHLTPFDQNGEVDVPKLRGLIKFLNERMDVLFSCGSYGLGPLMRPDQRKQVAETVAEVNGGLKAWLVHVGAMDTQTTVELAKHAESCGADGVLLLQPWYFIYDDRSLLRHFEKVIEAVSIPVWGYNHPRTHNLFTPDNLTKLVKMGLAGMKDSCMNIQLHAKYRRTVGSTFNSIIGTEEMALPAFSVGDQGFFSGTSNFMPELCSLIWKAWKEGNIKGAVSLQARIHEIFDAAQGNNIPVCYEIMKWRGVDCGIPRSPMIPPVPEVTRTVIQQLEKLDALKEAREFAAS
jgi:dihydrodipicolinate synthase/N-acetylneuraminate lyase